jgi:hypothetical protein
MRLNSEQRHKLEMVTTGIHNACATYALQVSAESWPVAPEVTAGLESRVNDLRLSVVNALRSPPNADFVSTKIAESTAALRRFLPEAKESSQIAAGVYIAERGEESYETAYTLEHRLSGHFIQIAKGLGLIEKLIPSISEGVRQSPGS